MLHKPLYTEGSSSMDIDANEDNELPDEDGSAENGDLGNEQSSFKVFGLKIDAANMVQKDIARGGLQDAGILVQKDIAKGGLQDAGISQVQQQQPQGPSVCWERFLNVRSIRVLLVENDDSTRHVISALLRNYNYEVLEAANGVQAWKFLEDLANHIDLVLTEVVMPFLHGIPLLNKIMSHMTRKNVPVIMMSYHDSMGLVFKCLSKGAVDFLVKPIRKNELKNLWKHVWRRCHSSSGSESGTQTPKSVKSKSSEKSDNNLSNDEEKGGSNGLNVRDVSDDGSGAQSSWTKQVVEVDSSQAVSPVDQVVEHPDNKCAQVIHSNTANSRGRRVHNNIPRENHKRKCGTTIKGKVMDPKIKHTSQSKCNLFDQQLDHGQFISNGEFSLSKQKVGSYKTRTPCTDVIESSSFGVVKNKSEFNKDAIDDLKETTTELNVKRLRGKMTGRSVRDDRFVLQCSEQSAFSRYNSSSNIFKSPNGVTASSSKIDYSVEFAKRESVDYMKSQSTRRHMFLSLVGMSSNIDVSSNTNKLQEHKPHMKDKSKYSSTISGSNPCASKPVKIDLRYSKQVSPQQNDMKIKDFGPSRVSHQETQIQHFHHPNNRHHIFNNSEEQPSCNQNELSLQKLTVDAPLCRATNGFDRPIDGNRVNYSLNISVSGSNNGGNGQKRSSTTINVASKNVDSDFGPIGRSGIADASCSGTGNIVDENRLKQQKNALHNYSKKQMERCFAKKVQYRSRKKLAEQRPHARGQFAKQNRTDSSSRTSGE